jgi:cyclin A
MAAEEKDHTYSTFRDTYLKYRKVVAEWMVDVCDYFNLHATTTHAAIAYLDRLQPNERFSRFEWQMLAISCILIASKYNECETHVPDLSTLEDITQQSISNETLLNYELWALKRMGWKLNARTPAAFLSCHFVYNNGLIKTNDVFANVPSTSADQAHARAEARVQIKTLANSMATSCMLNTEYKHYMASDMAIAISYVAREQVDGLTSPVWSHTLEHDVGSCDTNSIPEIILKLQEQASAPPLPPLGAAMTSNQAAMKKSETSPAGVDGIVSPFGKKTSINGGSGKENENPHGSRFGR